MSLEVPHRKMTDMCSDFLKERLFGLGNAEGNHGEGVREAHFHLDNTPVCLLATLEEHQLTSPRQYASLIPASLTRADPRSTPT